MAVTVAEASPVPVTVTGPLSVLTTTLVKLPAGTVHCRLPEGRVLPRRSGLPEHCVVAVRIRSHGHVLLVSGPTPKFPVTAKKVCRSFAAARRG